MPEPLLKLTGVSKVFGPVVALDRVDLEIGAAEAVEDVVPIAVECRHVGRHHVVDVAQAVEINV